MVIKACVRCGSRDIDFTPGNGDAILTRLGVGPVAGIARCKGCGLLSGPIEFEDEEQYRKFLKHLKSPKEEYKNNK